MTNQTETKRVSAIEATVLRNPDGFPYGLQLDFANGKHLTVRRTELSALMEAEGVIHGIKQKLVDAAAISRNAETGRSATVDDKYEAVREVYDRLLSGQWNATREGGGAGSLLFKALCRLYSTKEPAVLREWLDAKTDAEKVALRKNPKIAAIITDIQAEQAKADGIDTSKLLEELA